MDKLGPDVWAYAVLAVTLVVASVTDVRSGKIYNWTTYPAILIGLVGHALVGFWFDGSLGWDGALFGLVVGFGIPMIAWLSGGIGGGDAKVMGAVGALAGWRFAITAIFYGFAVAGIMALVVMLRKRIVRRTVGRVWSFLWLLVSRGKPGDPAGEDSPTIPFGLALCIGSAIVLALVLIFGPAHRGIMI